MKVFGGEQLTQTQIDGGLAAMKGRFKGTKVMEALTQAGAHDSLSGMEALLARELRNGRIRRITRGIFQEN
jgi:hypothetical protein